MNIDENILIFVSILYFNLGVNMFAEFGFWKVQTEPEVMFGHKYYVCSHKCNPTKLELVYIKGDKLEGKKELVEFIKKQILE